MASKDKRYIVEEGYEPDPSQGVVEDGTTESVEERLKRLQKMKRDPNVEYADEITFADRVRDQLVGGTSRPIDQRREAELDEDAHTRLDGRDPIMASDEDRERSSRHGNLLDDLRREQDDTASSEQRKRDEASLEAKLKKRRGNP